MYTLRFPFCLPPGQEIAVTDQAIEFGNIAIFLTKQGCHYVLRADGFTEEAAANHFINCIWAGLMWVLLHLGLSPDAVWQPQDVAEVEDAQQAAQNLHKSFDVPMQGPIHGLIDGARPAVYITGKNFRAIEFGKVHVVSRIPADCVLERFKEGIAVLGSASVLDDKKLHVALELYGTYFREISANARFLALVMALEALAPEAPRTQYIRNLLDKWSTEAKKLRNENEQELRKMRQLGCDIVDGSRTLEDNIDALDALEREIFFRTGDSIRSKIHRLVLTTLEANGDKDAAEMAKSAKRVYDLRSKLVHDGKLDSAALPKATSDARTIVERVLRARFLQSAAGRVEGSN